MARVRTLLVHDAQPVPHEVQMFHRVQL
jgi:hypothetical protein